ncbi:MAG TPA: hypothetical protein VGM51_07020 [Armatimonadota bacterium]
MNDIITFDRNFALFVPMITGFVNVQNNVTITVKHLTMMVTLFVVFLTIFMMPIPELTSVFGGSDGQRSAP